MRASDFDVHQRMYNLKDEIEAIAVVVRSLRERQASGDVAAAEAKLAAARAQLQKLSNLPSKALGLPAPSEFR